MGGKPKLSLVSSVWQSIGLLIRGPRVQAPHEVYSLVPGSKIMESKVLVAQWSARASSKGNDEGSNPSGHPSLLSSDW